MAARLMNEIGSGAKGQYTKGEVKTIMNSIAQAGDGAVNEAATCRAPVSTDNLLRGDVFIAKAVGGKVRPWIVLNVRDEIVTAVALSSGDTAPAMVRSECRLWPGSWIGSTLSQFSIETAQQEVTRPYTNLSHLRKVERGIYERMGAAVIGARTMAEIRRGVAS